MLHEKDSRWATERRISWAGDADWSLKLWMMKTRKTSWKVTRMIQR